MQTTITNGHVTTISTEAEGWVGEQVTLRLTRGELCALAIALNTEAERLAADGYPALEREARQLLADLDTTVRAAQRVLDGMRNQRVAS